MRFLIEATSIWFGPEAGDKLLEKYPCLKDYNPQVESTETYFGGRQHVYINIDTLDQLRALQKAVENPLIIDGDELEIYDGYRE